MKLVVESLEELFELELPGKTDVDILNSDEFKNLSPDEMLRQSAENGFLPGVKKALDRGADIHTGNDFVLRQVAYDGHIDIIELLLNRGADVHAENDGALRWAVVNDHKDVVEVLNNWIKNNE